VVLKLLANASYYIPELIATFLMCALLFLEATYRQEKGRTLIYVTSLIGLIAASLVLCSSLGDAPVKIFSNAVVIDSYSTIMKLLMVLGTLGAILISYHSNDVYQDLKSEFIILALGVLVGGMLLASANNLLTLYLGIETLSILSYVLSSLKKNDSTSSEAGMKYVLYGGVTAGVMLFGMSHIYGIVGSINFSEIASALAQFTGEKQLALMISFILFFVGIGYKISSFPFHMWAPDVYQGSPIPVTSFFSIVPKLAGLTVLLRVSMSFFATPNALTETWVFLLHIIAAMTMTVGNVTAIGQDSVKRLLAFSSIGHVGMMLLGVVSMNESGASSIMFYGIVYLFMTIVAFLITSHLANSYDTDSQVIFRGLIKKHPFAAISMIIVLFSLAGLPPLSGFVAKFNIISVIIEKKYYGLAFIAAINSVISLYYYMKLVKVIVFENSDSDEQVKGFNFINQLTIVAFTAPVLFLGVFWEKVMMISAGAKIFINK
jgi:NADH-quinone oxidoreductase subunit N